MIAVSRIAVSRIALSHIALSRIALSSMVALRCEIGCEVSCDVDCDVGCAKLIGCVQQMIGAGRQMIVWCTINDWSIADNCG